MARWLKLYARAPARVNTTLMLSPKQQLSRFQPYELRCDTSSKPVSVVPCSSSALVSNSTLHYPSGFRYNPAPDKADSRVRRLLSRLKRPRSPADQRRHHADKPLRHGHSVARLTRIRRVHASIPLSVSTDDVQQHESIALKFGPPFGTDFCLHVVTAGIELVHQVKAARRSRPTKVRTSIPRSFGGEART